MEKFTRLLNLSAQESRNQNLFYGGKLPAVIWHIFCFLLNNCFFYKYKFRKGGVSLFPTLHTLPNLYISKYRQLDVCKLAGITPARNLGLSFNADKGFFTPNFNQNIKNRRLMYQIESSVFFWSLS